MQLIAPNLDHSSSTPLYVQLYTYLKEAIISGSILPGERLPSLRSLSSQLGLSLTTVNLSYSQLTVEGYVDSKPNSGYYVNSIAWDNEKKTGGDVNHSPGLSRASFSPVSETAAWDQWNTLSYLDNASLQSTYSDPACFDFVKWKKCVNKILTDYSDFLLVEGDPRGESPLRYEISRYIYQARGVKSSPEQIVIGAGTQQLTGLLCILLNRMGIEYASFEEPGYQPVREIFQNYGFKMSAVDVGKDGIQIERLPANIRSTVYVSPANQFPTGSVMPIARRYELLEWASINGSVIIEDDYNSELRYFGKAVPSLQGLDEKQSVVYLGSFSSTLFPSIKISYMVLPAPMLKLFEELLGGYTQTCSKTEQLTLALYMEKGLYQTNIKKLKALYSQKIQAVSAAFERHLRGNVKVLNNTSGLHMLLEVALPDGETSEHLCEMAQRRKLSMFPVSRSASLTEKPAGTAHVIFYYTRIPLDQIEEAVMEFKALL